MNTIKNEISTVTLYKVMNTALPNQVLTGG